MLRTLNRRFEQRGTRFLVYAQSKKLNGFARPELIYVNAPPGSIRPGPEDDAIYVVDAADKWAYRETGGAPPYTGARFPPAIPNRDGHFDMITPTHPAFSSATVYASVKCVFEIWEEYFGRQLSWRNGRRTQRLEVIPRAETDNAWAGDGFLEFGLVNNSPSNPYCQNFDAVAHEVGHTIGWIVIGKPARRSLDYRANDEACADLIAIVSALGPGISNAILAITVVAVPTVQWAAEIRLRERELVGEIAVRAPRSGITKIRSVPAVRT